jgi:hypothetical protein
MSTKGDALLKVNEFEKRSSGTDWLKIKKDDLVTDLKDRLTTPDNIDTTVVNLCGPGAFFRCLVEDDPVMYVQAVINLYETNSALIGTRKFTASYSLRIAEPVAGMDQVDWVPLASLRDDENTVLSYDSGEGDLSGLTMPSGLKKWFKQANYTDLTNKTNVFFVKDLNNIKTASSERSAGKRACLLINSDMLKTVTQNHKSFFPDHWVTLMSDVTVDTSNNLSMKVHSWGKIMPIPAQGTMSVNTFLKNYYGFVSAKPPGSP